MERRTTSSSSAPVQTHADLDDPARRAAVRRLLPAGTGNPVLARLTALAAHVARTSSAHVSLVDTHTTVVGGHGLAADLVDAPPLDRAATVCARVAARGGPLVIRDLAEEDPATRRLLAGDGSGPSVRSYLGVPLVDSAGRAVGVVCVHDEEPRDWVDHDVDLVRDLAGAVAAELERGAAEAERNEAQEALHAVGRDHEEALVALVASASDSLTASLEPDDAVRSLVRLTVPALADWSVVTLLDEHGAPRDVGWWHRDPAMLGETEVFARHRLLGRTETAGSLASLDANTPYVVTDDVLTVARATLRSDEAYDALATLAPTSVVVVPLASRGRIDGTITLARGGGRPPLSEVETAAALDIGRRTSVVLGHGRDLLRHRSTSEELQRSMLSEPVTPPGATVEARYAPATDAAHVGGDWYDAFALGERTTMLVVGDVAGHDVAAAAAMGQLRSMVRGLGVTAFASPAALLDEVDLAVDRLRLDVGATALVCRLRSRPEGGARLTWAAAGHPPALLVEPDGSPLLLPASGLMLGLGGEGRRRLEQQRDLRPGSTLLLFTDGLVERRGESLDAGLERLCDAVVPLASRPLPRMVDDLLAAMLPTGHEDDVAVLAVRLDG
ncbi:GAF domain-containing SpoIIE family protein phosphatase [uncultured Nocardioides sp.]|uniref:GAF domain-containing SpoIIE family protein phosphatase n=1 Tax=uncultured Nocardioides sp. TaxID=198441 RepID=UPI002637E887|nr:GAF domain-containing SpoIIE family protein phosphatase [uncultured Nocardioides sp.]